MWFGTRGNKEKRENDVGGASNPSYLDKLNKKESSLKDLKGNLWHHIQQDVESKL